MPSTTHGTLTPNVVATATVDPGWIGIVVVNRTGSGVIWVRIDGQDPAPMGENSYAVLGVRSFMLRRRNQPVTVRMIAGTALDYTVEAE